MKVLVYFPRKKIDVFFEGAMLEYQIKKACKNNDIKVVSKFARDVEIANFINLNRKSKSAIMQAITQSIPTLLWMFYANNDDASRIVEVKKDGTRYIPPSRLDVINMMDAVIIPSADGKVLLRQMGVKIPIFVIHGAVDTKGAEDLKDGKTNLFRRYFHILPEQKYMISVLNIHSKFEIDELHNLAQSVPSYHIYAFISATPSLGNKIRLKTLNQFTAKNLHITELIPEDIYRYGLLEASYYVCLGNEKSSIMSLYEPLYLNIPIIINKKAIFSDFISAESAIVINDFNGAAYAIRNALPTDEIVAKAAQYTKKHTTQTFNDAIVNLFNKICSR